MYVCNKNGTSINFGGTFNDITVYTILCSKDQNFIKSGPQ